MLPKQRFVAIERHLLYPENNGRRFLGGLPCLVAGHTDDSPVHISPSAPGCPVPREYFLIPIRSKGGWDATETMFEFQRQVEAKSHQRLTYGSAHCTLTIPQLRHSYESDHISATQVNHKIYQVYKAHAADQIIEVNSFDELLKQFHFHLPDEPPEIDVKQKLKDMLSKVPPGPLNGVLVVAFDQQIAGSLASEELARKGATVIKVEREEAGDPKRLNSSRNAFATFNAGKFSVTFSNDEQGRKLKADLLSLADVVVDNRSTKAQERDEILQKALHLPTREKPLIFCGISGFGRDSSRPAYDRVLQAESGMADFNGKLIPFPIVDMATGKEAASEIMAHLFMRERMTPRESAHSPCIRLDVSMIAAALNIMANQITTLIDTGKPESTIVPFNVYKAKDKKISVAVAKDEQFARLCDVIETPELKKYDSNAKRLQHREEIESTMQKALARKNVDEWLTLLDAKEIPAGPVVSLEDALKTHGHQVVKSTVDDTLFIGSATASNLYPRNPLIGNAPQLGEHTALVAELTQHLKDNGGSGKTLKDSLVVSATGPSQGFRHQYEFIDPHEVDFNQKSAEGVSWVKPNFFAVRKVGKIQAEPAKPYEVVNVKHTDKNTGTVLISKNVAMDGDWKITTSFGDQYVLPGDSFKRNYVPVEGEPGTYKPNPELKPKKAVKICKNVCFMSSSNETAYIPAGGWLVQGSSGIYGIHPNNITGNYAVAKWASQEHSRDFTSVGTSTPQRH